MSKKIEEKLDKPTQKSLLYKDKQYDHYTATLLLKELCEKLSIFGKISMIINECIELSKKEMIEEVHNCKNLEKELRCDIQTIIDFLTNNNKKQT